MPQDETPAASSFENTIVHSSSASSDPRQAEMTIPTCSTYIECDGLKNQRRNITSIQEYLPFDPEYRAEKSWDPSPSIPKDQQISGLHHAMKTANSKATILTATGNQDKTIAPTPALAPPAPPPILTLTKPVIQTSTAYIIPATFDPYKYGRPSAPSSIPTKSNPRSTYEARQKYGPLKGAPARAYSTDTRTVTIRDLPPNPTLKMITTICKSTGPIETTTLFETLKKARVAFVNAADAATLFARSANGVDFVYHVDEKPIQHTAFVDMKPDVNFVSSCTQYMVKRKGATRCVKIVGWDRESLEYLVGAEEDDEPYDELLLQLARIYSYTCIDERVEGVKWRKNEKGVLEGLLIYARIKDAVCALAAMLLEEELQGCKITYGKDP